MGEESWNWLQARHSDSKERAIMAQALVWTGRVLQPPALAVLEADQGDRKRRNLFCLVLVLDHDL